MDGRNDESQIEHSDFSPTTIRQLMSDQALVNEEAPTDEDVLLDPEWRDKIPLDSTENSRGKLIGDLLWFAIGIGCIAVTMIAAGIGCGTWLAKWQGWDPTVISSLITGGGLTLLGWGIFR